MCGIIGYVGSPTSDNTLEILTDGLSRLEYRGYDSTGVAISNSSLDVYKRRGELTELEDVLPDQSTNGSAGIGHTRWSTHGPPTDENAHPHTDCNETVAVVHNGIIENYQQLRETLEADGHEFDSETDTEIIPHLIEAALERDGDIERAFRYAITMLEGSYAVAAVFSGRDEVYAARNQSPLVVGIGDDGYFLASDIPAFLDYTEDVVYLENGQFAAIRSDSIQISDERGAPVETPVETVDWSTEDTGKSGHERYMLKEIYEQPRALRKCLQGRLRESDGSVSIEAVEDMEKPKQIHVVACGTSYHASLYAARLFRDRGVPSTAFMASEYDVDTIPIDTETLVVGVTQSGETADTLEALREANRVGAETLSVTNVTGSSASRETDRVVYIRAGPEIGVAATKTFAAQLVALAMISITLTNDSAATFVEALRTLPELVQSVLDRSRAKEIATEYADSDAYFFIGRGYNAPAALEGALKTKEITYKHAEGFSAGELKHGPLALVTDKTPVFAVIPRDGNFEKMVGNVKEVEAREAPVIAVTDAAEAVEPLADHVLRIPQTDRRLAPILANVQLQLVSYWIANELGRSIDKPRNLAKSVTVK
ncbi:glutamine--fructose-6-phosphate transaminase (isomerizing) [Natrinema sp. DC36]|uniref:glutamine--fructose-6-phosphate transaminase (isomerizing) n=1 Tax=Natrinema sp. DC36 TaxID=2878680 RepID=UPI001CF08FBD|nr:glutamine--fructose-6-phosphate transaminase (isomerizing) [Natrinema sp. DC36]